MPFVGDIQARNNGLPILFELGVSVVGEAGTFVGVPKGLICTYLVDLLDLLELSRLSSC